MLDTFLNCTIRVFYRFYRRHYRKNTCWTLRYEFSTATVRISFEKIDSQTRSKCQNYASGTHTREQVYLNRDPNLGSSKKAFSLAFGSTIFRIQRLHKLLRIWKFRIYSQFAIILYRIHALHCLRPIITVTQIYVIRTLEFEKFDVFACLLVATFLSHVLNYLHL